MIEHVGWWVCPSVEEAEVVRRCGLWLPCGCPRARWGYFHWVRLDGPPVGLVVWEVLTNPPPRCLPSRPAPIFMGYAHALSPGLDVGDVVAASALLTPSSEGNWQVLWPTPIPWSRSDVRIVTAPLWVGSGSPGPPRRRQALYRQTGAWALYAGGAPDLARFWTHGGAVTAGVLVWMIDRADESIPTDTAAWRKERHRTIVERHAARIGFVLRSVGPDR